MIIKLLPQIYAQQGASARAIPSADVASVDFLVPLISNAITGITALAGVAILVTIVISGFTFLFSGGDTKQLEKAKNSFTYAIIGLVVIISAYLILWLIEKLTGADVTHFSIN